MKHSSYFGDKVQSLSLEGKYGTATVGVIEPGTYNFGTSKQETMVIVEGVLEAKIPGSEWKNYTKGEKFIVDAGKAFDCKCAEPVAYICYYK